MVANKIDLRGNGPKDVEDIITEATTWAREHDLPVIYTSAKTPTNVSDAFQLALALSIETRTALRHVVSIVLLGAGGVGKSCLRLRYTIGVFVDNYVRVCRTHGSYQLTFGTGSHN